VRGTDDRCAATSLSKAIGQTAKCQTARYCDDVYLQCFPRPAAIVFERFEGDEVGPGHWWGFCQIRLSGGHGSVWIRYFAGPMRPEPDAVARKLGWP
jgi:hypothetical protein